MCLVCSQVLAAWSIVMAVSENSRICIDCSRDCLIAVNDFAFAPNFRLPTVQNPGSDSHTFLRSTRIPDSDRTSRTRANYDRMVSASIDRSALNFAIGRWAFHYSQPNVGTFMSFGDNEVYGNWFAIRSCCALNQIAVNFQRCGTPEGGQYYCIGRHLSHAGSNSKNFETYVGWQPANNNRGYLSVDNTRSWGEW